MLVIEKVLTEKILMYPKHLDQSILDKVRCLLNQFITFCLGLPASYSIFREQQDGP